MREHIEQDFDSVYVLDLGGNVRKNPKLSGTTHNVFGIQVGVSINLFVRKRSGDEAGGSGNANIRYSRVDEFWRKEEKYDYLDEKQRIGDIEWQEILPEPKDNWLTDAMKDEVGGLLPMGT